MNKVNCETYKPSPLQAFHLDGPGIKTQAFVQGPDGNIARDVQITAIGQPNLSRFDTIAGGKPIVGFDAQTSQDKTIVDLIPANSYYFNVWEGNDGTIHHLHGEIAPIIDSRLQQILQTDISFLPPNIFSQIAAIIQNTTPFCRIHDDDNLQLVLPNGFTLFTLDETGNTIFHPQLKPDIGKKNKLAIEYPMGEIGIFEKAEDFFHGGHLKKGVLRAGIIFDDLNPTPATITHRLAQTIRNGHLSLQEVRKIVCPYLRLEIPNQQ
ncbi:MAG: hypothetical protein HYV37_03095 [Candidatus Levyibacteriota bacterium]|nr:MAG: hypothetical protein HYV37_03095 [Candidatus Levybacteria bacterium]